jgi:hypothetical protein
MKRTIVWAAVLGSLLTLISRASAQEKNELTGLFGRTFVSDQGVTGTSTPGALLTSGAGLSVEANYGRRLLDLGLVGLTGEVPFVVNFKQNVHYDLNLVPKDYKSFFVTPSIRANLFPDNGLSPWVRVGGGVGYFKESSSLDFRAQPRQNRDHKRSFPGRRRSRHKVAQPPQPARASARLFFRHSPAERGHRKEPPA